MTQLARKLPSEASLRPEPIVRVLGVPFSDLLRDEAVAVIRGMLRSGRTHRVVLANAQTLNLGWDRSSYRLALADADLVLRDGLGVEIGSILAGHRLRYNFVGTDFVPHLLAQVADLRPRVCLFGAAPGVAEAAGARLERSIPGGRIAGVIDGFGDHEAAVEQVRAARADVVLVALGNPRQEEWIARHADHLGCGVAIGVGALFDYLAERVPRAPEWVLRLRSEWIYRLCVEPRRLWRRYLVGNPRFLWRLWVAHRQGLSLCRARGCSHSPR